MLIPCWQRLRQYLFLDSIKQCRNLFVWNPNWVAQGPDETTVVMVVCMSGILVQDKIDTFRV